MVSKEEYKVFVDDLLDSDDVGDVKHLTDVHKKNRSFLYLGLSLFLTLSVFFLIIKVKVAGVISLILALAFFVVYVIMMDKKKKANEIFKHNIRYRILSKLLKGEKYTFVDNEEISESTFKSSQFCDKYSEYNGSDKLTINIANDDGSKSKCDLVMCDLDVRYRTVSENHKIKEEFVYKGVFGYVYFANSFNVCLCINSSYSDSEYHLEECETGNKTFNKEFKVLCSDSSFVDKFLNSSMSQTILNMKKLFGNLKITVVENRLYIGLGTDLLEFSGNESDIKESFYNLYDELHLIMEFIDEIKLNNSVFKTEE